MTITQKRAWLSFKNVVEQFLGNFVSPDWKKEGSRMVDILLFHVEYFSGNLGNYSEEQSERFHKDIKVMEQ